MALYISLTFFLVIEATTRFTFRQPWFALDYVVYSGCAFLLPCLYLADVMFTSILSRLPLRKLVYVQGPTMGLILNCLTRISQSLERSAKKRSFGGELTIHEKPTGEFSSSLAERCSCSVPRFHFLSRAAARSTATLCRN